ncbi:hypothetical protein HDU76_010115, partial [Blyttiomyces sp. JEL0837]
MASSLRNNSNQNRSQRAGTLRGGGTRARGRSNGSVSQSDSLHSIGSASRMITRSTTSRPLPVSTSNATSVPTSRIPVRQAQSRAHRREVDRANDA